MKFRNREEAGRLLAQRLTAYAHRSQALVLALPRGGVLVGAVVAQALHLPLDIICPRKIGAPCQPEYAIGAVTERGDPLFNTDALHELGPTQEQLIPAVTKEKQEAWRRLNLYRSGHGARSLKDRHVLLIDDGLATGLTMQAAIQTVRQEGAATLCVAVPVAPPDTLERLRPFVDTIICLYAPLNFYAIGAFYDTFSPVSDEHVINTLRAVWSDSVK